MVQATYCSPGSTSLSPMYTRSLALRNGFIQENPGTTGIYVQKHERRDSERCSFLVERLFLKDGTNVVSFHFCRDHNVYVRVFLFSVRDLGSDPFEEPAQHRQAVFKLQRFWERSQGGIIKLVALRVYVARPTLSCSSLSMKATGWPWRFPDGEVMGVLMSAWASTQIRQRSGRCWAWPATEPMAKLQSVRQVH